ncbi:MAG: DUF1499 domain-containing protein [Acidobacteria bacterium]|nr:DUF1499 domain-containing protein [Acidobacteriota bacterium]
MSCAGTRPTDLGVRNGRLAPCSHRPNCVSSDATDAPHAISPLVLRISPPEGWAAARIALAELPRTRVIAATADYLRAESSSALLGFVDDVELHLRAEEGLIAVRSASRLGFGDMGVNRRRIDMLRAILVQRGVAESAPRSDQTP